jgi:hypothetical protein
MPHIPPVPQKGPLANRWSGGQTIHRDGRIGVYAPNHPFPNIHGTYVFRYRLVMEESIGRILDPKEVVHHINGDPTDDRIENLQLCKDSAEHGKIHNQLRTRTPAGTYE